MPIKALIFDFDGLILDSETPDYLAWRAIYQEYGTDLDLKDWLLAVGSSLAAFDPVENLETRIHKRLSREQLFENHRNRSYHVILQQNAMPGIVEYLDAAIRRDLRLCIASSSPREWVVGHLSRLNLLRYFDHICVSNDVKTVKPDPALYLCAIHKLGIQPFEGIALEDSLNGVIAAKRAGLYCVAIPNTITVQQDFRAADLVLTSLTEITLEDMLSRANGKNSQA